LVYMLLCFCVCVCVCVCEVWCVWCVWVAVCVFMSCNLCVFFGDFGVICLRVFLSLFYDVL